MPVMEKLPEQIIYVTSIEYRELTFMKTIIDRAWEYDQSFLAFLILYVSSGYEAWDAHLYGRIFFSFNSRTNNWK